MLIRWSCGFAQRNKPGSDIYFLLAMVTKTLYVGNLPYSATDSDLLKHFSAYNASNARVVDDRGFGFVDVPADQLHPAIEEKHDSILGGRKITVNEARPRPEPRFDDRPQGGGYRDDYGRDGRPQGERSWDRRDNRGPNRDRPDDRNR